MHPDSPLLVADFLPPPDEDRRRIERSRLIAYRRERSASLGPCMRLQFEDERTVRQQIREVMRAERITTAEGVMHEIATYAHLVPSRDEWKATLFIELPDARERRRELPGLSLAVHDIHLVVPEHGRVTAHVNEDVADRHLERPSAVHFVCFRLPLALRSALLGGAAAWLACTHERYEFADELPPRTLDRLREDLKRERPAHAPDGRSDHVPA